MKKLENSQIATIAIANSLGIGILMVQHPVTDVAKQDAWISMIITGFFVIVAGCMFYYLCMLHPGLDLPQIYLRTFGRIIGSIFLTIGNIYILLDAGFSLRIFANSLKIFLLDRTPIFVIVVLMAFVIVSVAKRGIFTIASVAEILLPVLMLSLIIIVILTHPQWELDNIRPVMYKNTANVIRGIIPSYHAFIPYNVVLYTIPYAQEPKKTFKWVLAGGIFPLVFYIVLTLVTTLSFGPDEILVFSYPILTLIKSIEFPVTFLERLESFMVFIWISAVFISLCLYLYVIARSIPVMLSVDRKYEKHFTYALLPLLVLIASIGENLLEHLRNLYYVEFMGITIHFVFFPVLIIVTLIKKRR